VSFLRNEKLQRFLWTEVMGERWSYGSEFHQATNRFFNPFTDLDWAMRQAFELKLDLPPDLFNFKNEVDYNSYRTTLCKEICELVAEKKGFQYDE